MLTPYELACLAVKALDSKKGGEIAMIHTGGVTVIADYFVICTAGSAAQTKSLADEVSRVLEEQGENAPRVEGHRNGGWVLIDFGCLVVHIFTDEARKFYNLERLWADCESVDISALINE